METKQENIIIGISGKVTNSNGEYCGIKNAGKDTVAQFIKKTLENKGNYQVFIYHFASVLKDIIHSLYGWDPKDFTNEVEKSAKLPGTAHWTYRKVCEQVGDLIRNDLDEPDFFRTYIINKIKCECMSEEEKVVQLLKSNTIFYNTGGKLQLLQKNMEKRSIPANLSKKKEKEEGEENKKIKVFILPDVRFYEEHEDLRNFAKSNNMIYKLFDVRRRIDSGKCTNHISDAYKEQIKSDIIIRNNKSKKELEEYIEKNCIHFIYNL